MTFLSHRLRQIQDRKQALLKASRLQTEEIGRLFAHCERQSRPLDYAYRGFLFVRENPWLIAGGMALATRIFTQWWFSQKRKADTEVDDKRHATPVATPSPAAAGFFARISKWIGRAVTMVRVANQIRRGLVRFF
jgi:hypothetical protein